MNTKIRSRTAFPRMLEETLFKAYQEGKRSVDFLLLGLCYLQLISDIK